MQRGMAAVVFCVALTASANATLAQTSPARPAVPASALILVTTTVGQDGTRYLYEISQERADALPQWDQRSAPDPPLSMSAAKRAAESWLTSRIPEVKTFDVSSLFFAKVFPAAPADPRRIAVCWYYRITFDPVLGGRRLNAAGDFTVVVLLDGSIVEPRRDDGAGLATARAATAASTSAAPPIPVRVGTAEAPYISPPQRIKNVNPVYPADAQSDRVQGVVIIEATIGADGKVTEAHVLRSIPLLDGAALDAVRQWEYAPTILNGVPVPVIITVTVNFALQ